METINEYIENFKPIDNFSDYIIGVIYRVDENYTPAYDIIKIDNKLISLNPGTSNELSSLIIETNENDSFVEFFTTPTRYELVSQNENMMFADGFDKALIGIRHKGISDPIAVYDFDKCVDILIEDDGMSYGEAIEYFEYNTLGAYVGENTPCFLIKL